MYERKKVESKADALATIHDLLDEMEQTWYAERRYDSDEYTSDYSVSSVA